MREHKFRAWDEQNKTFYYFTLEELVSNLGWEYGLKDNLMGLISATGDNIPLEYQEYIELADMNSTEIYVGDIVKCVPLTRAYKHSPVVIEYDAEDSQYNIGDEYGGCGTIMFRDIYDAEIIGNIHESPELMEKP